MLKRAAVAITLVTFPLPASAGWGGAEWGIDREAVSALRGEAPVRREGDFDSYSGTVGSHAVVFNYAFDGDDLTKIEISPVDVNECPAFRNTVRETYGTPFYDKEDEQVGAQKWIDEANGNQVNLLAMQTFCAILYEPIKKPNAGGF